jgi:hypothetical protein
MYLATSVKMEELYLYFVFCVVIHVYAYSGVSCAKNYASLKMDCPSYLFKVHLKAGKLWLILVMRYMY